MTKTEAIAILESRGWRFKNVKRATISVCDPGRDDWYQVTTGEIKQMADFMMTKDRQDSDPEPIHKQEPTTTTTVPVLERDTQAIADAIEKACRIVVMVAVACYVAGYTLGVWVHTVNAWLVALHKRTCQERVEIVLGYIVDGIVSTSKMVEVLA